MSEPLGDVRRECVEGYLFSTEPLEILLFRRPPSRGRIWVPISGKTEPGDADLESALRRELREETGLAEPLRLFSLDWHVRFRADNGETWRLHGYGVEIPRSFLPRLSEEHEECVWLSFTEGAERLHYSDNREALRRLLEKMGDAPSNL